MVMMRTNRAAKAKPVPSVFVSYSHDDLGHKLWVLELATRLQQSGIDTILDQWSLRPGNDVAVFMERQLASATRVIMVCTRRYVEKANAGVERISENRPSSEKVLDKEPDFVSASFTSTLAKGGVAPREQFEQLGVPTYISPADCAGKDNSGGGDGARTAPLTMDSVYTEVRELARVFGVPERGDALVKKLRARVDKATDGVDASNVSLLYWFSDSKAPYLAGCCGAPGVITEELGAKNVFDDTHDEWPQISWETVADRNPDVLVIGDLTRTTQSAESAAKKIEFLESDPVTRTMDAVKNRRYVLLSGQAMNPTIRTVEGLERVAAGLRGFGLAG